ncbi:MAG TPA: hypothetical protein VJS30_22500 [Paraburkholderia sp.]|nr:hypothetical protein [Paraburkholderia sp.]
MQRRPFALSLAPVTAVVLATIMLAACGPGTSSPSQDDAANAPARSSEAARAQDSAAPLPQASVSSTENVAGGIEPSAQNATNATNIASAADFASNAVASVQASLAADSQQVAPIMSYAPGDAPPPSSTGNDSSSTATTSQ